MQVFDPNQDYSVAWRRLPHWAQAGAMTFMTWRTWDSMPNKVIAAWVAARDSWLRRQAINPDAPGWEAQVDDLAPDLVREFRQLVADRWNEHLDECHGGCVLRQPENAKEVAKSLLHFDGDRYEVTDFVVMPNHVHLLAAFRDEQSMLRQCESWKHYTATRINRRLGRKGRFWQQDGFDHLVRSPEQFEYLRRYCAENPARAHLRPGEFVHYSRV